MKKKLNIYICWLFPLFPHIYLFELGLVDIHLTLAAANNRQGKFKSIESQDPSLCLPKELLQYLNYSPYAYPQGDLEIFYLR